MRSERKISGLEFTKISGTGNHFILIDNRRDLFTGKETGFFATLCRSDIVGADGVLLVSRGKESPVGMRYFNRDGHEARMCGNGARCCAYYAREKDMVSPGEFMLEASDGLHRIRIQGDIVHLGMQKPHDFKKMRINRKADGKEGGFVNTGVPHYVLLVEDLDSVNVDQTGSRYRYHPIFSGGTNVNFVQAGKSNSLCVRTYERGVEGETLSCGTGCVASAYIGALNYGLRSPIRVQTRGGMLEVHFNEDWSEVTLSGEVRILYKARMSGRMKEWLFSKEFPRT